MTPYDTSPSPLASLETRCCMSNAQRALPNLDKPVLAIVHQETSTPGRIGHWLRNAGYRIDMRRPRFGDPLPTTLDDHAAAIIFGGPMSANDNDDFIKREIDWIGVPLREERPFLGVCLGGQMMARHLGARVSGHDEGLVEVGYYPIHPTDAGTRLCPWPDQFYQWHVEGFELPDGAVHLAETGSYKNQAMLYGPAALGVQFHPEITYTLVNRWTTLAPHRFKMPGAKHRRTHIEGHHQHTTSVGRWLDTIMPMWLRGELGDKAGTSMEPAVVAVG